MGKLVVLQFALEKNSKTNNPQFQCRLGDDLWSTTYVIEAGTNVMPEVDVKNPGKSPWFLCEEVREIARHRFGVIVTVVLRARVNTIGRQGFFHPESCDGRIEWLCDMNLKTFEGSEVQVTLFAGNSQIPKAPGEWFFRMTKSVLVEDGFIAMEVELTDHIPDSVLGQPPVMLTPDLFKQVA